MSSGDFPSIEGYEVQGWIGSGNMADVYRARQVSLDRVVALKVLHADLKADREFRGRFLQEARAAARLDHPNIVAVYDVGVSGGRYYIAFELVEGPDLDSLIESHGPLPEHGALKLIREVALGLEVAAKAGIVHRDLKPDNILLTRENQAKIADLGLAKDPGGDVQLSQEGMALGTPVTFSPEQAQGRDDLDPRSDLYALGATLFFLLTGRYPFDGDDAQEIMRMHLQEPVPDPRRFAPHKISDPVRRLIFWLLQKDRSDRPESPRLVVQAIDHIRSGALQPAGSGGSRRRWLLGAGILALVAGLVVSGFVFAGRPQAAPPLALERDLTAGVWERFAARELEPILALAEEEARAAELEALRQRYPGTDAARRAAQELMELERRRAARQEVADALDHSRALAREGRLLEAYRELDLLPPSSRIPPLDATIAEELEVLLGRMAKRLAQARLEVRQLLGQRAFDPALARARLEVDRSIGPVRDEAAALVSEVEEARARHARGAPERLEQDRERYRQQVLELRRHVGLGDLAAATAQAEQDPGLRTAELTALWEDERQALGELFGLRTMAIEAFRRQVGEERLIQLQTGSVQGRLLDVRDAALHVEVDGQDDPLVVPVARLAPLELLDGARDFLGGRNRRYYRMSAAYALYLGYLGEAIENLDVAEALPGEGELGWLRQVVEHHRLLFPEDADRRRTTRIPEIERQPVARKEEPAAPEPEPEPEPTFWTAERKAALREMLAVRPQFRGDGTVRLRYALEDKEELKDFIWVKAPEVEMDDPRGPGVLFRAGERAVKWTHRLAFQEGYTVSFRLTVRRKVPESVFAVTFAEEEDFRNLAVNFGRGLYWRKSARAGYQPIGEEKEDGLSKTPVDRDLHLVLEFSAEKLVIKLGALPLSTIPLTGVPIAGRIGFEAQQVDFQLRDIVIEGKPVLEE